MCACACVRESTYLCMCVSECVCECVESLVGCGQLAHLLIDSGLPAPGSAVSKQQAQGTRRVGSRLSSKARNQES